MRVVMVGDFPRKVEEMGGGVEAVVTYLASELNALPDIELEAVTMDRWGGCNRTENQNGYPVHFVSCSRLPSRLSNRQNIKWMASVIRDARPDIVHAHIANQYAAAAQKTGVPWVLTAHGVRHLEMALRPGWINRYREWNAHREEFRLMAAARHLISISPFINSVFKDTLNAEVSLIDNPVNEVFFEVRRSPTPGQILYVGRLIPRKDLITLLRAFAQVLKIMPDARLRLAGEGVSGIEPTGYPMELMAFIRSSGMEDAVQFLGQLDEASLLREYERCSVMAVSSVLETAPMVILQAMAASVPVVSTDVGGIRWLVDNGNSGALVAAGDWKSLAGHLSQVLADPALASTMGENASRIATERFRAKDIATKTRKIYLSALGRSSEFPGPE